MSGSNCAVVGCRNNSYQLSLWKKEVCEIHINLVNGECACEPPFHLFCFPSINHYRKQRELWANKMRRIEKDGSKWLPKPSDRVCSDHFIDQIPTEVTTPRRALFRQSCSGRKRQKVFAVQTHSASVSIPPLPLADISISQPSSSTEPALSDYGPVLDHSYSLPAGVQLCPGCVDKNDVIDSLSKKVSLLKIDNQQLTREKILAATSKSFFSWRKIKSDAKMNFYTGLSSIQVFNTVFSLIEPILPQVRYWRGTNRITSTKVRTISRSKLKKLCCKDEFLLTLLRIRLGILNEDLADRLVSHPLFVQTRLKPGFVY